MCVYSGTLSSPNNQEEFAKVTTLRISDESLRLSGAKDTYLAKKEEIVEEYENKTTIPIMVAMAFYSSYVLASFMQYFFVFSFRSIEAISPLGSIVGGVIFFVGAYVLYQKSSSIKNLAKNDAEYHSTKYIKVDKVVGHEE